MAVLAAAQFIDFMQVEVDPGSWKRELFQGCRDFSSQLIKTPLFAVIYVRMSFYITFISELSQLQQFASGTQFHSRVNDPKEVEIIKHKDCKQ